MSIIKNRVGSSTDVTIMKLEKGVALASPPLPSSHPLLGYTAKLYLQLKAYSFQLGFYPRAGETVIIRAAIDPGATGVIYGIEGSSGRCIKAENGYIRWYNGDTVVLEKAIDGEVHNFGYQGYDDEGTLKCRPYYDKENMSSIAGSTAQSTTVKAYVCAGTANTPSNVLTSSGSWAIRIYEIAASSYPDSTDTSQYHFHYYAAINTSSVACLMETRHDLVGVVGSGTTKSVTDFASVGYGIQLHDLKWITGSGYNDLMAIITEDGGLAASEADGVDHIRNSGMTIVHDFAIRLADGRGVNVSNPIPVPSGFTITRPNNAYKGDFDYRYYIGSGSVDDPNNYSGFLPYVKGDLIYGRKPNWPIWADGITWGKYVEGRRVMKADVNMFYQNLYFLRFNIFKDFKGTTISELLERWHGLNTGAVHAPSVTSIGGLAFEFHNRVACVCNSISAMTNASKDDMVVFKYSLASEADINLKIGNLAPWDIPHAQQTGDYAWIVRGATVDFIYDNGVKLALSHAAAYGTDTDQQGEPLPFCKESSENQGGDKYVFRNNGKAIDSAELDHSVVNQLWDVYVVDKNGKQTSVTQATFATLSKMGLLMGGAEEAIAETNTIHLDYILPSIGNMNIVIKNDPKSFKTATTTPSRFVVGEPGGKAVIGGNEYELQIYRNGTSKTQNVGWNAEVIYQDSQSVNRNLGYGIGAVVALKSPSENSLLNINTNEIIAFMDYRMVSEDQTGTYYIGAGRYIGFTKVESNLYPDLAPRYLRPLYLAEAVNSVWGISNFQSTGKVWPSGMDVSVGGTYNVNHLRMALFRWKDLVRSTVSDYNQWHQPYKSGTTPYPSTAHLRVFEKSNGPVAWDLDIRNLNDGGSVKVDANTGQLYIDFTKTSGGTNKDYRFYFLNTDRIMPRHGVSVETLIDCRFTAWYEYATGVYKRFDADEEAVSYNIDGISIYIDEIPLHYAREEGKMTTVAKFTNVVPNHNNGYDNNGYHLELLGPQYNPDYVLLPSGLSSLDNGEAGAGLKGFYQIKVTVDGNGASSPWHAGSLYVLRFESTAEYNDDTYDEN